MANSFRKNGVQRCRRDTVIKMAMKRTWIEGEGLKEIEGMVIEEVPKLELTDEGVNAGNLKPMEGLGRRGGIEVLYDEMTKALEIARSKQKKLQNTKRKITDGEKIAIDMEVDDLAEDLKQCPYWTFRIVDQGKE